MVRFLSILGTVSILLAGCSHHSSYSIDASTGLLTAPATFDEAKRLLLLDGDDGTVACRVYGTLLSGSTPRLSESKILESASRSLLRMKNLTAVRGLPGASMIGPLDYFGNLEGLHQYAYTIKGDFPPLWQRSLLSDKVEANELKPFEDHFVTTIQMNWVNGTNKDKIVQKNEEYAFTQKKSRQSLFPNPGLLEVDRDTIELKYFDPREVDLSSFHARLVDHSKPFQITSNALPHKDDYRIVTYLYEPGYADWQVEKGNGHFIEEHLFSQTMTPLTPDAKGFVVLARLSQSPGELDLIGVQIPYGYTLIIEKGCIHGDVGLNGFFMMGMTSDHVSMRTADTVFLKSYRTKENVRIQMTKKEDETLLTREVVSPPAPYVIYNDATEEDRSQFRQLTEGQNFIFNPFSREYWK